VGEHGVAGDDDTHFNRPEGICFDGDGNLWVADFGNGFAESVFDLSLGDWQGPVLSGYGLHLVQVSDSQEAAMPELADVEGRVLNEYLSVRKREADEAFYDQVRSKYTVTIEEPGQPAVSPVAEE
jgi:hypothetical protein